MGRSAKVDNTAVKFNSKDLSFSPEFESAGQFNAMFDSDHMVDSSVSGDGGAFSTQFQGMQVVTELKDADPYLGDYEVTPKVEAQVLPTENKLLSDDVTVEKIPYFEVTNTAKGKTVTIA